MYRKLTELMAESAFEFVKDSFRSLPYRKIHDDSFKNLCKNFEKDHPGLIKKQRAEWEKLKSEYDPKESRLNI